MSEGVLDPRHCHAAFLVGGTEFHCKLLWMHLGEHKDFGEGWKMRWDNVAERPDAG